MVRNVVGSLALALSPGDSAGFKKRNFIPRIPQPPPCLATEAVKGEEDAGGMVHGAGFKLSAQLVGHMDVVVAHLTVVLRRRVFSSPTTRTATR